MRYRMTILSAIGVGLGLFGLKTFWDVPGDARGADAAEKMDVVVAACDIGPTCEIGEDMVTMKQIPRTLSPRLAFGSKEEAVGRVARITIPRGSPVMPNQLARKGTPPGLALVHTCGRRPVRITVDCDLEVAQWLKSRTHVDVVSMRNTSQDGQQHTVGQTSLRDVEVLALEEGFSNKFDAADATIHAVTATIAVEPRDIPILHLQIARDDGRLRLKPARQPVSSKLNADR